MRTILRAALVAASVVAVLAAGGTSYAASPAPDTLGAAVQRVVYLDDGALAVRNMSTLATTFTFASDQWTVEPSTLTLVPDEEGRVVVSGDGDDGSTVAVTMTTAGDVAEGTMRTALAFAATVRHDRPFDLVAAATKVLVGLGLVLVVARLLVAATHVRRRFRVVRVEGVS